MCIIIHKWSKWGRPVNTGSRFSQFRECSKCGILSRRRPPIIGNVGFNEMINSLDKLKQKEID